jgi:hypothetical protein
MRARQTWGRGRWSRRNCFTDSDRVDVGLPLFYLVVLCLGGYRDKGSDLVSLVRIWTRVSHLLPKAGDQVLLGCMRWNLLSEGRSWEGCIPSSRVCLSASIGSINSPTCCEDAMSIFPSTSRTGATSAFHDGGSVAVEMNGSV